MVWCCIPKFLFSVNQKQIGALVSHFLFHFSHHCLTRVCSIGLCLVSYASLNIATRERLHISIWNQYVQRIFCRLLLSFFRSSQCHFLMLLSADPSFPYSWKILMYIIHLISLMHNLLQSPWTTTKFYYILQWQKDNSCPFTSKNTTF